MSLNLTQKLSNSFVALCDRYLYPGWKNNDTILFRARTLIGLLIVYQVIVVAGGIFSLFFSAFPVAGNATTVALLACIFISFNWLMRYLPRSGELMRAAHLAVATAFVGIEAGILVSGGPMATPSLGLAVVSPVLAFFLIGRRAGLTWTAIAFAMQLLMVLLNSIGVDYINLILPEQIEINRLFNGMVAFSAVIGIVLVYEITNEHLQRDRNQQHQRFQHLALHDALTGLANRKQFTDRVRRALATLQRSNSIAAVIYLDLNGFKHINDMLGHEAGDKALQIVAQRLSHTVRQCDTVARLGGDEFAVLLEDIGDQGDVEHMVQRLQAAISAPMDQFRDYPIQGSFGIALAPQHACEADTLLHMADKAMYDAKKQQSTFKVYNPQQQQLDKNITHAKTIRMALLVEEASANSIDALAGNRTADKNDTLRMTWAQQLQQRFIDHSNHFLPPRISANSDPLFRGRILIGCLRFSQVVAAIFMLNLSTLHDLTLPARALIGVLLAIMFIIFGVAPSYLRRYGNFLPVSTMLIACIFTAIETAIFFTGGPALSTTLDLAVVPALAAFCLGGRKHGFAWAGLAVTVTVAMLVAERLFGLQFPMLHERRPIDSAILINWIVCFTSTVGIVFVYELLNQRLQHDRDMQRAQLEYLATHDLLTGVANRRKFLDVLQHAIERMHRNSGTVAVAYLDLDGFKPVNDTLGHDVGDQVLKIIAQRLNKNVRSTDTVARLGGDEFGIIMENVGNLDNAIDIASKVQQIVSRPIAGLEELPVGSSIGIAMAPLHCMDSNTLMRMADHAMFRAKIGGSAIATHEI